MEAEIGKAVVAAMLGLLLGLEREHTRVAKGSLVAGIRTFPLLCLAGFLGAVLSQAGSPLALPAVFFGVGGLVVVSYLRTSKLDLGATTEATALLAPLLGALVAFDKAPLAAAVAVVATLLLAQKDPLRRFAGAVSGDEILGLLKFGIVAVVLVPLLPTTPMGPQGAIVPRHVGLVVLTICGVSLGGYALVRLVGGRAGWGLAGPVLVVARVAQARFGTVGFWGAAAVGGLVDVDSVTLASADLRGKGVLSLEIAAGGYMLGTLANLAVKAILVAVAGGPLLSRRVLPGFLAMATVTVVLLVLP